MVFALPLNMLRYLVVLVSVLGVLLAPAQTIGKEALIVHLKALASAPTDAAQDSLNVLIKRNLKGLLDAPGGFDVVLDDVPISRVEAADGAFRLFTWNLPRKDGSNLFEGQLLVPDGRTNTLYELRDMTSSIPSPEIPELGPDRWYGALYYQVIPVKKGGKTYYTLLGWKGYNKAETRKVIDVLSFRGSKPRFGAPLFGSGKLKKTRLVFGYSFQATMMLRYETEQQRIVLDHLSPMRAEMVGQNAFLGPDLSYDAYQWEGGQWQYQRDIDARDPKRDGRPFNAPPKEQKR